MENRRPKTPAEVTEEAFMSNLCRLGEYIAEKRRESGMTQANVAERLALSDSEISRIERGERMTTLSKYRAMFELFGMPLDEALAILLDGGHYGDDTFNRLRIAIRNEDYDRMREMLAQINEEKLAGNGLFRQLYLYVKTLTGPELDIDTAITKLTEILCITNRDFNLDNISNYRLRFDELMIINGIGKRYINAEKFEEAAKVFQAAMTSMDKFYLNERMKSEIYSVLLYNLSTCYGELGNFKEAERVCQDARKLAARYGKLNTLPFLLNNIGEARRQQGDITGSLDIAVQAYYVAQTVEKQAFAKQIEIDAKRELGIDLSIIQSLLLQSADPKR
jgi:transcriptional regulator with XRE-family HTH domain